MTHYPEGTPRTEDIRREDVRRTEAARYRGDYAYQAYRILQFAFIVIPIIAGLDKFFNFLVSWPIYLSPHALEALKGHGQLFMYLVGIVEIVVGLGMIYKPKIFSYLLALWLLLIIINLILTGHYFDIAARDFGLLLGALALGRLSHIYDVD